MILLRDQAAMRSLVEGCPTEAEVRAAWAARLAFLCTTIVTPPECDGCGRDLGADADEGLCPSCACERIWGDD